MRTLHDFFQPTSRATGADAVVSAPSSSAAPVVATAAAAPASTAVLPAAAAGAARGGVAPPPARSGAPARAWPPPPAGAEAGVEAGAAADWPSLSAAEREEHWAEPPRRRRRLRRHGAAAGRGGGGGGFRAGCRNEVAGLPVEAWRRVYRHSWAAPLTLALEDRDQVEVRGGSWSGARHNGVRDIVEDVQFDQVGALLAAACRDGRVQIHDFDEFATRVLTLNARTEAPAPAASGLPPRCDDTEVLTLAAREVGAGVAWDPITESHVWAWYHSSNAVHLYDIERCRSDTPTRVYKPPAAATAGDVGVGVSSAQFATGGGNAILSTVFAVGGRSGAVFFYDKRNKTVPIYSIPGRNGAVSSMQLSGDGQLLLFSTSGTRHASPMIMGYDVRAICSHSAVGREVKRNFGEEPGARGRLLRLGVDAAFRAPRAPRTSGEDIAWVKDQASGSLVSQVRAPSAAGGAWTYTDRSATAVAAATVALSPCGANELAYQLEDGSVGQLDLGELCRSWSGGVDGRGGPPQGRARSRSALPFTQPPMPAARRFKAGFTTVGASSTTHRRSSGSVFYHDTHPSVASGVLSMHDFSRRATQVGGTDAEEAAAAVWRAKNPLAQVALGDVERPHSVAFHPGGDVMVIGGEKNTVFARMMGEIPSERLAWNASAAAGAQAAAGGAPSPSDPSPAVPDARRAAARAARAASWAQSAGA